jgi:hypothetical protein
MVSGHRRPVPVLRLELGHHAKALFFQCFAGWPLPGTTLSSCAYWSNKKSVDTAQNLENKRPKTFLPRRSMVLKVVRGKILETLELRSPHDSDSLRARAFGPLEKAGGLQDDGKLK